MAQLQTTLDASKSREVEPLSIPESREHRTPTCDISIVIPIYNEEDNIAPLYDELKQVLESEALDYEIIFINDGSRDRSSEELLKVTNRDDKVTVVELRRNFGQTAAMAAGIHQSNGRIIVPMDGDLQNDPHSIPLLLKTIDGPPEYDIVSGWRKDRKDKMWTRRVPSQIANWIISRITGVHIHDFGCTMKAYRRSVIEDVSLSSDLHRFLPALAAWHGARTTEVVVNHRPRIHGVTKYGLKRTFRVLLDLIIVKFMGSYVNRPLYFFGKLGLGTFLGSMAVLLVAICQRFGYLGQPEGLHLNRNVLVSLSALLAFLTVQCLLFGIMAELLVRVYHDSRGHAIYRIRNLYKGKKAE
ncbi:MAG: glycosyltransferase family 2 protein [Phycisphaerae bacterium]